MSLKVKIQITVNISSLSGVEILKKGKYSFGIMMYTQQNNSSNSEDSLNPKMYARLDSTKNGKIDSEEGRREYLSRKIQINFITDEYDHIDDRIIFHTYIYLPKDDLNSQSVGLYLESNLYYSENSVKNVATSDFMQVMTKTFKIGDVLTGTYKYVPVEYSVPFCAILHTTIVSTIQNKLTACDEDDERLTLPEFLTPESWEDSSKISYEKAHDQLVDTCNVFVNHFNKLRDCYKELHKYGYVALENNGKRKKFRLSKKVISDTVFDSGVKTLSSFVDNPFEMAKTYSEQAEKLKKRKSDIVASPSSGSSTNDSGSIRETEGNSKVETEPAIYKPKKFEVVTASKLKNMKVKFVASRIATFLACTVKDIAKLSDILKKAANTKDVIEFLRSKYYIHYKRLATNMKKREVVGCLDDHIDSEFFENESKLFKRQTKKYLKFTQIDTTRGLCYEIDNNPKRLDFVVSEELYKGDEASTNSDIFEAPLLEPKRSDLDDISIDHQSSFKNNEKLHCVFLCHGYSGKPDDVCNIANEIYKYNPDIFIHKITSVESSKEKSIEKLGYEVAKEIDTELCKLEGDYLIDKITIIGYSMGGLIMRAALPYLSNYEVYFENFVSIASPNIGYINIKNSLFTRGMWLAGVFSSTNLISEISLSDKKKVEDCFLYRLSQYDGLNWFNKVIFIGSSDDGYSPLETSIVQMSDRIINDSKYKYFEEMQQNIIQKISHATVYRLKFTFKVKGSYFDVATGRKAHIEFIENLKLIKFIVCGFGLF